MTTDPLPQHVQQLIAQRPVAPLGPGQPLEAWRSLLQSLQDADFPVRGRACRAALWLAFNFLDESHTLSQDIETVEGSFWHAIMHRREPDPFNSKYWFRRVGSHPVFALLRDKCPPLGYAYTTPEAFVDFCERVRGTNTPEEELAQRVQHLEWELLFSWCAK